MLSALPKVTKPGGGQMFAGWLSSPFVQHLCKPPVDSWVVRWSLCCPVQP